MAIRTMAKLTEAITYCGYTYYGDTYYGASWRRREEEAGVRDRLRLRRQRRHAARVRCDGAEAVYTPPYPVDTSPCPVDTSPCPVDAAAPLDGRRRRREIIPKAAAVAGGGSGGRVQHRPGSGSGREASRE